jgi:hypothetical protein
MTYPDPGPFHAAGPLYPVPGAPYLPGFPGAPEGPLGDLQNGVANVLNGADRHHIYLPTGPGGPVLQVPRGRQPSMAGYWVKGAHAGFGAWLVWQQMKRRRATKGEYTSPGFRALGLMLLFPAVGLALSMLWVPESGYFLGWGCALGAVSFITYATYRATGHGRFNTRRPGSAWRGGHRP